jgi:hypothetical protein
MTGPTNPSEVYFDKGLWGFDGTQWRRLNLLFGYYDRYVENLGNTNAPSGTYTKNGTSVPSGQIWVVNCIGFVNATGARGQVALVVVAGGVTCYLKTNPTPTTGVPDIVTGNFVLKSGDYVLVQQYSVVSGDYLIAYALGYKMKVA